MIVEKKVKPENLKEYREIQSCIDSGDVYSKEFASVKEAEKSACRYRNFFQREGRLCCVTRQAELVTVRY